MTLQGHQQQFAGSEQGMRHGRIPGSPSPMASFSRIPENPGPFSKLEANRCQARASSCGAAMRNQQRERAPFRIHGFPWDDLMAGGPLKGKQKEANRGGLWEGIGGFGGLKKEKTQLAPSFELRLAFEVLFRSDPSSSEFNSTHLVTFL